MEPVSTQRQNTATDSQLLAVETDERDMRSAFMRVCSCRNLVYAITFMTSKTFIN